MLAKKIPTAVYYPIPLHRQKPYRQYPVSIGGLKNTDYLSKRVLSLPMHPYLQKNEIEYVCCNLDEIINEMII